MHELEIRGIALIEPLELTCQRESGVVIVTHVLIIFCQMLEGGYTLTFGETLPCAVWTGG